MELAFWANDNAYTPLVPAPDDWPAEARLPVGILSPLFSGDHAPGSCAIYAAVNAIRVATHGHYAFGRRDEFELLENGWSWRARRGHALPSSGMRSPDFARMVDALCFAVARTSSQYLTIVQPWRDVRPNLDEFFTTLERLIASRHAVVLLFAGAHYSVVRGFTASSLLLFDSAGRSWISRNALSLAGEEHQARHRVWAPATLAIRRCF